MCDHDELARTVDAVLADLQSAEGNGDAQAEHDTRHEQRDKDQEIPEVLERNMEPFECPGGKYSRRGGNDRGTKGDDDTVLQRVGTLGASEEIIVPLQ